MATLRDIKRRITGVKNTQQITKAMKMVAAAKLRRAQDNIINAKPYSRKISEVINNLMLIEQNIDNPLTYKREVDKVLLIVVTGDSGLCGAFNMNVIRDVENKVQDQYKSQYEKGDLYLYCIGKKGFDYFSRRNYKILDKKINIFKELSFEDVSLIVNDISQKFTNEEFDKVDIFFNEFKSIIQQRLVQQNLLPIVPKEEHSDLEKIKNTEYIFEPNKIDIINSLLPKYLKSQVWRALLDSYAAELGARMTAMDMATENASELISSLQMDYNKARQSAITTEILEIVSGAEALQKG